MRYPNDCSSKSRGDTLINALPGSEDACASIQRALAHSLAYLLGDWLTTVSPAVAHRQNPGVGGLRPIGHHKPRAIACLVQHAVFSRARGLLPHYTN